MGWILLGCVGLGLALVSTGGSPCRAENRRPEGSPRPAGEPNRLANETSPYLRSAAQQPVDWYPFGPEAFRRAQELDRPVLLDIGAVWCHWCHVMDRESYESAELAALLNEHFIAVKVDRDARPDIDARYQRAVQALTGQGGWPLTVFLTPKGKVIYGGTYFPREVLERLLRRVEEVYRTEKDRVTAAADEIARRMQVFEEVSAQPGAVSAELLARLTASVREEFDPEYGGPRGAPKFPHGAVVRLALERYQVTGERALLQVAEKTLDGMARGGLRDHLQGGFFRYSTDRFWHVPHFEKMAYVQAELLAAYSEGYRITKKPLYREAAEGVVAYLTETLSDPAAGGFYASQDADVSLEDDGSYYTWTLAEMQALLTRDEAQAFALRYGVGAEPERHVPSTPDRNVLYSAKPVEEVAAALELPAGRVKELLARAHQKLRAKRLGQKAPFVDKTKFTDWNALLLSAYAAAYRAFEEEPLKEAALRTTDFLLAQAYRPGAGMRHAVVDGGAHTPGLLEDQVYMAQALLDMYEMSGRERYLQGARDLMEYALREFWDAERGGFFDVAHGEDYLEVLAQPRKEIQDAPLPGPNAVAALTLDRLAKLTGEARYRQKAEETLQAFAGSAARLGTFAATYARALNYHLASPAPAAAGSR